jgi:valyl-tRNA synthetase
LHYLDPVDVIQGATFESLIEEFKRGNLTKKEQAVAAKAIKTEYPNGIPAYGTDALRLALASSASSQVITFDIVHVVPARLFCNKLWQACRFVQQKQAVVELGAQVS